MTPMEIRIAFLRKGITYRAIAKKLNVSDEAVSAVVKRKFPSARIREAVAEALGHDVKYVFPEAYIKKRA